MMSSHTFQTTNEMRVKDNLLRNYNKTNKKIVNIFIKDLFHAK